MECSYINHVFMTLHDDDMCPVFRVWMTTKAAHARDLMRILRVAPDVQCFYEQVLTGRPSFGCSWSLVRVVLEDCLHVNVGDLLTPP